MKKDEMLEKMELIDERFIEEAAPDGGMGENGGRVRTVLKVLIPAALVAAAALFVVLASRQFFRPEGPEKTPYETKVVYPGGETEKATEQETATERRWEEMETYERFTAMTLGGTLYEACYVRIDDAAAGEKLSDMHFVTEDWNGNPEEIDGEVFRISGINPEYLICVRYQDTEGTYSFLNPCVLPKDLGDFFSGLNAESQLLTMDTATYYYCDPEGHYHNIQFEGITREFILNDILEAYQDAPYSQEFMVERTAMSFGVQIPELCGHYMSLGISENGYLWSNLMHVGHCFYIGEDAAKALIEKVDQSFTGYELIYDFPDDVQTDVELESGVETMIEYTSEAHTPEAGTETEAETVEE